MLAAVDGDGVSYSVEGQLVRRCYDDDGSFIYYYLQSKQPTKKKLCSSAAKNKLSPCLYGKEAVICTYLGTNIHFHMVMSCR